MYPEIFGCPFAMLRLGCLGLLWPRVVGSGSAIDIHPTAKELHHVASSALQTAWECIVNNTLGLDTFWAMRPETRVTANAPRSQTNYG